MLGQTKIFRRRCWLLSGAAGKAMANTVVGAADRPASRDNIGKRSSDTSSPSRNHGE